MLKIFVLIAHTSYLVVGLYAACTWYQTTLLLFAGTWSSPPTSGTRPPPCSSFSFTAVNNHQAVLFGGNQRGHRIKDCFLIDFESMVCSKKRIIQLSNVKIHYRIKQVGQSRPSDMSFSIFTVLLVPGVDQTGEVQRSPLASAERLSCSLLPQLWRGTSPTADHWRSW